MYVYQDGKLYAQVGDKLIGVEIHSDKVLSVEGTETVLGEKFELLTPQEVQFRFHIFNSPYIFPREEKLEQEKVEEEVVVDEPIKPTKKTVRKSTRK